MKAKFVAFTMVLTLVLAQVLLGAGVTPTQSKKSKKRLNTKVQLAPGKHLTDKDGTVVENTGKKSITVWYYENKQVIEYFRIQPDQDDAKIRVTRMDKNDEIVVTGEETDLEVNNASGGVITIDEETDLVLKDSNNLDIDCKNNSDDSTIFGKPQTKIDPELKVCVHCNSKIKKMWSTCPICGKNI